MIQTGLLILHIFFAISLIALILIQQGKGATAGAAFGAGASNTMFGSRGSASFLTRTTAVIALLFFSNSLLLAYLSSQKLAPQSLMEQVQLSEPATVPAALETPLVPESSGPADLPIIPTE